MCTAPESALGVRLASLSTFDVRLAYERTVRSPRRIYGVKGPVLNGIAKELAPQGAAIVDELWAGSYEERIIAAKILGRCARKTPQATWTKVQGFAEDLDDWATCDTLATEAVRGLLPSLDDSVFAAAMSFCAREGEWQRRFGFVLLTNFAKDLKRHAAILDALQAASSDKRHYVRKALEWLRRDLRRVASSNA